MKHSVFFLILLFSLPVFAQLHVVATYPYIGDIVQTIGKEHVDISVLARGDYNPHIIIPKPSFIAKIRKAQLLIINGAELEIGWLPQLLRQANNPVVQTGEKGFLDLSGYVTLQDVPTVVSRGSGDVHPSGNPHFYLDPYNIPLIAKIILKKLKELDSSNASAYETNYNSFIELWQQKLNEWSNSVAPIAGSKFVQYHALFNYFLSRFQLTAVATIEPLAGIPPTSRHLAGLEQQIKQEEIRFILQDVYNPRDAATLLARKTGVKVVILPHDVNSVKEATTIVALFDEIVRRLTQ